MTNFENLPDATVRRITDYVAAGAYRLRGRHGFRIPAIVADDWTRQGYSILRTNTLAKRFGAQRKTMWLTIRRAIDEGFIKEIGRTQEGRAMYVPCLERGDEWRASLPEAARDGR